MDEQFLRQQLCQAAQQLWLRGLVAGDGGLVTIECHRRRYLVTPPGRRRSDLQLHDPIIVDAGGINLNGDASIAPNAWLPHRIAYQIEALRVPGLTPMGINATILAMPPMLIAVMRLDPQAGKLELPGSIHVHVVAADNEAQLRTALESSNVVALRAVGVLSVAPDLATAQNAIEQVEHAAAIEIATRR